MLPATLSKEPGRPPRLVLRPPLHSTADSKSAPALDPTACPESLMPLAMLYVAPGRPPRLTGPPPPHSTAYWARAEPAVSPSRPAAAKRASANDFRRDMSLPRV